MAKINSLTEFALKLNTAGKGFSLELQKAIAAATVKVHSDAVKKFGTYQPKVGPFQAWAALNSDYVAEKMRAGSQGDDPLIGHYAGKRKNSVYPTALRAFILYELHGLSGVVGTNDPLGKYHEFGTRRIPARSFLRPALYQNREWIREACKEAIAKALRTY